MSTVRQRHRATVKDNDDPEKRGRLKVASASLMGVDTNGEAVEYPEWIEPSFPALFSDDGDRVNGGLFAIPSPGVLVDIEISTHSTFDQTPGQTEQTDPEPRWKAAILRSSDGLPEEFRKNYPFRFGYKTASGHLLIFDDTNDLRGGNVWIEHRSGAKVELTNDDATLSKGRMQMKVSSSGVKIGLSPAGPELLTLFDQLLLALRAFTAATKAAAIEPTLAPSATALEAAVIAIQQLLAQIRG